MAATWWALFHVTRPSRARSRCQRCGCDIHKGAHVLGPGGPGAPFRVRSQSCPRDIIDRDPEVADALERYRLAEALGLRAVEGPLGDLDYRTATLAAAVASEVPWIHEAIRRSVS